jgi:hypothetical protein
LDSQKGRDHLGDVVADRKVILKGVLKKYVMVVTEFGWCVIGPLHKRWGIG